MGFVTVCRHAPVEPSSRPAGGRADTGCLRDPVDGAMAPGGPWRITDRATFEALRRSSCRVRRGPITISFVRDEPGSTPRVGYAIGRRVGGAVHRNRLRRRLRAIAFELGPHLQPGAYLIAAAPAAAGLSYGELRTIVSESFETVAGGGRS
ncbi:MAG: ribonuclease P protein component [Actinobacteria bacterium]|nr:MAG: ribonuclease P protein component [Actinomycetota bacterium]